MPGSTGPWHCNIPAGHCYYIPPPACSYSISSNWKWKKTQIENPFFGWTVANVFLSFHWPSVGCYFKHKENVIFCLHFWHHPHGGGGLESWGIWQYQMGTTGLTWAPFIRDKNKYNQENSIITKKKQGKMVETRRIWCMAFPPPNHPGSTSYFQHLCFSSPCCVYIRMSFVSGRVGTSLTSTRIYKCIYIEYCTG